MTAMLAASSGVYGQPSDSAQALSVAEGVGQAEVALQGYYLGGAGQPLTNISGFAETSAQFVPRLGLLTTSLEGYGSNGLRTGNIYAGLQGVALWGWHWDLTGGDFRFSSSLVTNPFNNV